MRNNFIQNMNIIVERNWRREVRQRIHGVGNVGEPKDIKFPTQSEITEALRKIKNLEITKSNRITNGN